MVEFLIYQGADINARTVQGLTPSGGSKKNGKGIIVEIPITHGAKE